MSINGIMIVDSKEERLNYSRGKVKVIITEIRREIMVKTKVNIRITTEITSIKETTIETTVVTTTMRGDN